MRLVAEIEPDEEPFAAMTPLVGEQLAFDMGVDIVAAVQRQWPL